ncbi:hypothetical protein Daesc_008260 [Daldinia eschscholtzii]|uniref:Peptidase S8/S53 domain-containing protein n=1 Tax=Daldinia eschscholtzii TaxID=292717 RepID=A0AAX6MC25_9PEZI
MTNIISQLDPCCIFYIAQVADDGGHFSEEKVIEAIEWHISEGVEIINCSFALSRGSKALKDVVRKAKNKDIILMCSTSDEGENRDKVWPAAFYTGNELNADKCDNVIPIVGCDKYGKPSHFSNEDSGRFYFYGEDIDASANVAGMLVDQDAVKGSSVATAMATGIASLILACLKMVKSKTDEFNYFQNTAVVTTIFNLMLSNVGARGKKLVKASLFFPVREEELNDEATFKKRIRASYNKIL